MSRPTLVQRFTPLPGCRFLSMNGASEDQASVHIRSLCKTRKPKHPEDLYFTTPLREIATFADTLDWDGRQPIEDLPRIWRATRRSGRFILVVMGGEGSCLVAQAVNPDDEMTLDMPVQVHPHSLHLPVGTSLVFDDIRFGIKAGNRHEESRIEICADPGTGPDGASLAPKPGPEISPGQEKTILTALDQEIIAWGETLSAARMANRTDQPRWPAELCRHVLPCKETAAEMSKVIRAVGIRAYEKFANDSANELVIGVVAPNRPSALQGEEKRPWSAFINHRHEMVSRPMRDWIEQTLQSAVATRWPEGWYDVIGPAETSRLGVQSQTRKTMASISGPISNHQKIEAMGILGPLY